MVRMDSDIARPEDLRGRRVGVHGHFNPIALWIRGLLQHEFDVPPSVIHWVADGAEHVAGWSPPSWLRIERAPAGRKMQEFTGERASWMRKFCRIVAPTHQPINKVVRRLWPNYREVEADYYRRTGIFPIRHVVVVKDEVLQRDPDVAVHLVRAFEDAKQQCVPLLGRPPPLVSGLVRRRARGGASAARSRSPGRTRCRRIESL